ncbi:uncharacterized protein [Oscarella lobularis]|uniref:uncharacterized protein n=1 Tax=Oscarella lobularis TaxID=121494 RepID=UPI003313C086
MAELDRIRSLIRSKLERWKARQVELLHDVEKSMEDKREFIKMLKSAPLAVETEKANEQHYEVPTAFFETVLGKWRKYSSCLWPEGVNSIDAAEESMLSLCCQRAKLEDGHSVLDLGCGWGSLTFWILEKYPRCRVTCVSNSRTQRDYIESTARARGFADRLQAITCDARVFTTQKRFDRIISVEMFEHMRNYRLLLQNVASWLKPSGFLFVQILCHRNFPSDYAKGEGDKADSWLGRNFFSGGIIPSDDLLLYFQDDVSIADHWRISGVHYQKTLEAWLALLDRNRAKVERIFESAYGRDEVESHVFNWRLFFASAAESFGFDGGSKYIVSQYLFRKKLASSL